VIALRAGRFGLIFRAKECAMTVFTVTTEGEVTLTKEMLERLDIHPGDQISIVERPDGKLELSPVKNPPPEASALPRKTGGLEAFFGSLKNEHDIHFTLDELKEEIEKYWARQT
jgi:bifunctional DNA-binding transcriptional regulator/antitoxin component of YhaV-PrlF toxin-antitoxin module